MWVFGFEEEPDVTAHVRQVENLLGEDGLECAVTEAGHGRDPRGYHLRMRFASQHVAECLRLSLDDLVASRTVQARWVTRLTGPEDAWDAAWGSQAGGLLGFGAHGDGDGGSASDDEAAPALVVVTFLRDASWPVVQHMVGDLIRCGFSVREEDFSWDQQRVVSIRVPGETAHDIADQLGGEFFAGLGPLSIPHASTRVVTRPTRARASHSGDPVEGGRTTPVCPEECGGGTAGVMRPSV